MPVFGDFDFQTALSPQRGYILGSRSFAPARFWELPLQATAATQLYGQTWQFRAIPTRQNDRVSHVCAASPLRDHIFC